MPRVAIIADSHFDEGSRFAECVKVHDFIAEDIARKECDLAIHTGDVYERASTPEERRAVACWVTDVTQTCPLLTVKGNHDAARDLMLLTMLETKHPVIVEEAAGVHVIGGCVVGCLAWPNKASVLALARDRGWSHEEGELVAGAALRAVLLGLGQHMDEVQQARGLEHAPRILAAHAMISGSKVSTGQPLVGCDLELGLNDLALARASLTALGHIHLGQQWATTSTVETVVYPGSPRRTAYGETETKGYVIADFEGAKLVSWQRVETPCAPMVLLEATWTDGEEDGDIEWTTPEAREALPPGAEVRVRYRVDADQRAIARIAFEELREVFLAAGAADVKLEERVAATSEARAPEVATALTLPDKLNALWRARGNTPDTERTEALFTKVNDLETAERAA